MISLYAYHHDVNWNYGLAQVFFWAIPGLLDDVDLETRSPGPPPTPPVHHMISEGRIKSGLRKVCLPVCDWLIACKIFFFNSCFVSIHSQYG